MALPPLPPPPLNAHHPRLPPALCQVITIFSINSQRKVIFVLVVVVLIVVVLTRRRRKLKLGWYNQETMIISLKELLNDHRAQPLSGDLLLLFWFPLPHLRRFHRIVQPTGLQTHARLGTPY